MYQQQCLRAAIAIVVAVNSWEKRTLVNYFIIAYKFTRMCFNLYKFTWQRYVLTQAFFTL